MQVRTTYHFARIDPAELVICRQTDSVWLSRASVYDAGSPTSGGGFVVVFTPDHLPKLRELVENLIALKHGAPVNEPGDTPF
jgi:hypothetical protein